MFFKPYTGNDVSGYERRDGYWIEAYWCDGVAGYLAPGWHAVALGWGQSPVGIGTTQERAIQDLLQRLPVRHEASS